MTIKHAGIALIIGVVLSFISGLFFPGNALNNPVDQLDYTQAVEAIADAPEVAHLMTFLSIFAMLFIAFAFVAGIYPLTRKRSSITNTLLQFGIIVSVIEWSIIIIGGGMRHIVIHLAQRAANPATSPEDAMLFSDLALDVHVSVVAVFMAFIPIFPLASILVGIGLVARMPAMNLSKISAYGIILVGAIGFIVYFVATLAPGDDPNVYLTIYNLLLFFGTICFLALGYGMVKGDDGLKEETVDSQ